MFYGAPLDSFLPRVFLKERSPLDSSVFFIFLWWFSPILYKGPICIVFDILFGHMHPLFFFVDLPRLSPTRFDFCCCLNS